MIITAADNPNALDVDALKKLYDLHEHLDCHVACDTLYSRNGASDVCACGCLLYENEGQKACTGQAHTPRDVVHAWMRDFPATFARTLVHHRYVDMKEIPTQFLADWGLL